MAKKNCSEGQFYQALLYLGRDNFFPSFTSAATIGEVYSEASIPSVTPLWQQRTGEKKERS